MFNKKLYKNKEWLYKQYWEEKLSIRQIAKLCYVCGSTIRKYMKRFNINSRSISESEHLSKANHCILSQKAIEWLNGELLGDGSLYSFSQYSAGFAYSSKHKDYIKYVRDILKSFGIEQSGKINEIYYKKYDCYTYHYVSRSYVELLPIRKKWYPKGKKIIPKDLELKPITLRQHYIGDGKFDKKNRNPNVLLCTDSFPISDVIFLIKKLEELGFKTTRQPSRNRILIWTQSTKDFLNYIGKCPVKCYQYKFEY